MIKNELEYQVTQDWVKKFKGAIAAADRDEERKKNDRERWQINRDVLQVHLDGLLEEIGEYEMLLAHDYRQPLTLTIDEFNTIPQLLIKAPMAAKLTQQELGDLAKISGASHICKNTLFANSLFPIPYSQKSLNSWFSSKLRCTQNF